MRFSPFTLAAVVVAGFAISARAVEPATVELNFDTRLNAPDALQQARVPAWVTHVDQEGGAFLDEPRCWRAEASAPKGTGRLTITLDRQKMNEDLVATVLFEAGEAADIVVQLFDAQGRAVEVDLFGNLVQVGQEATTDTYVIPLRKYPTAEKIVLRRVEGEVKIYGLVLYPAVTEGEPNNEALRKLAAVLGDPLSPQNPLLKGLTQIAKSSQVELQPVAPKNALPKATPPPLPQKPVVEKFPGAVPPPANAKVPPVPAEGLVAYWNFERGAADAGGRTHDGTIQNGAVTEPGNHGPALRLRRNPSSARLVSWDSVVIPPHADFDLKETMTVAAWIKYKSIARTWGSQIVWFGDSQYGRDPWNLHLLPGGRLEFRTDRSVTGKPVFTVFEDEIKLTAQGKPMLNQHVSVEAKKVLAPETWYFVAGTVEKLSPRLYELKLFVNGEMVGQTKTSETVNYPTNGMWMTIGGVDKGTWQNFDGLVDEVRVYGRALSDAEIQALYNQPWK